MADVLDFSDEEEEIPPLVPSGYLGHRFYNVSYEEEIEKLLRERTKQMRLREANPEQIREVINAMRDEIPPAIPASGIVSTADLIPIMLTEMGHLPPPDSHSPRWFDVEASRTAKLERAAHLKRLLIAIAAINKVAYKKTDWRLASRGIALDSVDGLWRSNEEIFGEYRALWRP